jgi:hypothetical protein
MLSVKVEQRFNVKFLAKLRKFATETYSLLMEVYGDKCLSRAQVFQWLKGFEEGRGQFEDDPRPSRPCTSKQILTLKKSEKLFEKIVA